MTPEEFVQCFSREKKQLLDAYLDASSESAVARRLSALGLTPDQMTAIRGILGSVLTDAFYTTLLSLDGCASLGGVQQSYTVRDEQGAQVCSGDGTVEGLAYDYFHGNKNGYPGHWSEQPPRFSARRWAALQTRRVRSSVAVAGCRSVLSFCVVVFTTL